MTAGQLALARVLAQGDRAGDPSVVPIPGTERVAYLEADAAATDIGPTDEELRRLDDAAPVGAASGDRYPDRSGRHRRERAPSPPPLASPRRGPAGGRNLSPDARGRPLEGGRAPRGRMAPVPDTAATGSSR